MPRTVGVMQACQPHFTHQSSIELVSRQSKVTSALFRVLIACANEAAVTDQHNYTINKTWQKQKRKTELFARIISGEPCANRQKQLWNDALNVTASQSGNNQLAPEENENRPKKRYTHFCTKAFNYLNFVSLECFPVYVFMI